MYHHLIIPIPKKKDVSRTYKGYDGYAPVFAYLGQKGCCINTMLHEGKAHSQKNTVEFLEKIFAMPVWLPTGGYWYGVV
jgi:hypothetical protein